MDVWAVLEVEQTSDKKLIKRAYAKKLKTRKPDVDPEGFQELRRAYEIALQYRDFAYYEESPDHDESSDSSSDSEESPTENSAIQSDLKSEPLVLEDEPDESSVVEQLRTSQFVDASYITSSTEDPSFEDTEQADAVINSVCENTELDENDLLSGDSYSHEALHQLFQAQLGLARTLFSTPNLQVDERKWGELIDSPIMIDLYYKPLFTTEVFILLIKAIRKERLKKKPCVEPLLEIMWHLEESFNWRLQQELLEQRVDYSDINLFLEYAEPDDQSFSAKYFNSKQHQGPIEETGGDKRFVVFFIDVCIFAGTVIVWNMFTSSQLNEKSWPVQNAALLSCLAYFLYFTIMEASPFQGTVGRVIMGQKVVSTKGKRLNIFHSLYRSLWFLLYCVTFKFSVWINFFLKGHQNLYDRLSRSMVINK